MSAIPLRNEVIPSPLPTPRLHLRLVRQALPPLQRLTGKTVMKAALEQLMKLPLAEALTAAIRQVDELRTLSEEQVQRVSAISLKLVNEGLRLDDAISVALHEPAHLRTSAPMPQALKDHVFPRELTGANVLKVAFELNHDGMKMDDAIIAALKKFWAPREVTSEQAAAVLEAAQALFKEGRAAAEAFDIALHRALPKHGH